MSLVYIISYIRDVTYKRCYTYMWWRLCNIHSSKGWCAQYSYVYLSKRIKSSCEIYGGQRHHPTPGSSIRSSIRWRLAAVSACRPTAGGSSVATDRFDECIADVEVWLKVSRLRINPSNTQVMRSMWSRCNLMKVRCCHYKSGWSMLQETWAFLLIVSCQCQHKRYMTDEPITTHRKPIR